MARGEVLEVCRCSNLGSFFCARHLDWIGRLYEGTEEDDKEFVDELDEEEPAVAFLSAPLQNSRESRKTTPHTDF